MTTRQKKKILLLARLGCQINIIKPLIHNTIYHHSHHTDHCRTVNLCVIPTLS